MRILVIVNDQPYGSERPYNALRLAGALAKREEVELRVFLLGDSVACAVAGQQLPEGHYHLDRMLKPLIRRGEVGCCGTCMDARGLGEEQLVEGRVARPWRNSRIGRCGRTRRWCSEQRGALSERCCPPRRLVQRFLTEPAHVQEPLGMEPTGIEPVTSCLQSARSRLNFSAERERFAGISGLGLGARIRRGCTRIIGDYRGFGHFWR
jgi:uncharacterized protein involved in oxidation of intracellular sulfur